MSFGQIILNSLSLSFLISTAQKIVKVPSHLKKYTQVIIRIK